MSFTSSINPNEIYQANDLPDTFLKPANPATVNTFGSPAVLPRINNSLVGGNKDVSSWLGNFIPTLLNTKSQPVTGVSDKSGSNIQNRSYKGLVVTKQNYNKLVLAEIARQNRDIFNGAGVPNSRQVSILDAFRQLAGLSPLAPQSTADFLLRAADELGLSSQTKQFTARFGTIVGEAGDVVKNVTSPIGLTTIAIIGGAIIAVVLLR